MVADSALQWNWNSIGCVISAHVNCEGNIQTCPSPAVHSGSFIDKPALKKASGLYGLYEIGESIVYACQKGYALHKGSLSSKCLPNGTWSQNTPVCKYHDCKSPEEKGNRFDRKHLCQTSTIKYMLLFLTASNAQRS